MPDREAYVPLSPDRRARSREIWDALGARVNALGMTRPSHELLRSARAEQAASALIACTSPGMLSTVTAELTRRTELFARLRRETPKGAADPQLAALESVLADVRAGYLG